MNIRWPLRTGSDEKLIIVIHKNPSNAEYRKLKTKFQTKQKQN